MADSMCAGGRGKTCSFFALTVYNEVPALRPCNTEGQKNPHLPPQPSKPAASCTGDSSKQVTAAALRGWNTVHRTFPPGMTKPASLTPSEIPLPARGPTSYSPPTQPATRRPRKQQAHADNTQFPTMADTSLQMSKSGKLNIPWLQPKGTQ
ncbi:Hypothetical predicted protein [Pelobates cultripes]|uniref:Uncharacterized protein n=1 Tax=Pelobates cultripes TaxID=61616 RepID=A0AAD1TFZ5_PELCU|nr:Hypothetical predicted protein [Pelobates cultripes]